MDTLKECKNAVKDSFKEILNEVNILKDNYSRYFVFDVIFSTESTGKTRLNRQIFNENNEKIQISIKIINDILDNSLEDIRMTIRSLLSQYNDFNKVDLINLIFDDNNFIELLQMDLENQVIPSEKRQNLLLELRELTGIKNKIFNLKYYSSMFNTDNLNRYLNRLGIDDLINSRMIFELINTYGLQAQELEKFETEMQTLDANIEKTKSFKFLEDLFEHHVGRTNHYTYAGVRYKISIDYNDELTLKKELPLKKAYLENIISNLIEQSCMDVVKKELKKGKIQKFIDVNMTKRKGIIQIVIKNNGYEVNNIHSLYLSDSNNRFIIESRNLAREMGGTLEVTTLHNEGMQYLLEIKGK